MRGRLPCAGGGSLPGVSDGEPIPRRVGLPLLIDAVIEQSPIKPECDDLATRGGERRSRGARRDLNGLPRTDGCFPAHLISNGDLSHGGAVLLCNEGKRIARFHRIARVTWCLIGFFCAGCR